MDKQNLPDLENNIRKKYQKRDQKKKRTMKVSGAGVRNLQKIIKDKRKYE